MTAEATIVALNANKLLYSARPITESTAVAHHPLSVTALKLNSHHHLTTRTGTGYCENYSFSTSIKPRTAPRTRRRCTPVANEFDTEEDDTRPQINIKPPDEEETESLGVKAVLCMLKFYKREISPLLPRSCRYVPTCSEYSMEAYKKYGVVKGTILTTWRICRCNPFGGSGFDPPRWFGEERLPEQ